MPSGKQCWAAQKATSQGTGFDMTYRLPGSLAGCKRVVVQWWWQTTNRSLLTKVSAPLTLPFGSCISPTWNKWKKAGSWPCSSGSWPSWNFPECSAAKGTKAGSGEQFAALIDIPLGAVSCDASNGKPPPPPAPARTPPPAPPPGPARTQAPAPPTTPAPASGDCTGDPCDDATHCRSRYGYCGPGPNYCSDSSWSASRCSHTQAPAPPTTPAPASGDCTGDPCDDATHCRSRYGYCGPGPNYCSDSSWSASRCQGTASRKPCKGEPCQDKTHCRSKWGFCGPSSLPGYCTGSSLWNPSGCGGTTTLEEEDKWEE